MAKSREIKMSLPSVDDLFSTQEERDEAKRETVRDIAINEISDFPNHPFKVKMDQCMIDMAESVKEYGVLVPALVRQKSDGGYEMVSGHRRKMASELAGKNEMPCIVRNLTDDEAVLIMVDSNLQREEILPSEKAFAYKMKLDAMNRQAGRPSKNNLTPVVSDFHGVRTNEALLFFKLSDITFFRLFYSIFRGVCLVIQFILYAFCRLSEPAYVYEPDRIVDTIRSGC